MLMHYLDKLQLKWVSGISEAHFFGFLIVGVVDKFPSRDGQSVLINSEY